MGSGAYVRFKWYDFLLNKNECEPKECMSDGDVNTDWGFIFIDSNAVIDTQNHICRFIQIKIKIYALFISIDEKC